MTRKQPFHSKMLWRSSPWRKLQNVELQESRTAEIKSFTKGGNKQDSKTENKRNCSEGTSQILRGGLSRQPAGTVDTAIGSTLWKEWLPSRINRRNKCNKMGHFPITSRSPTFVGGVITTPTPNAVTKASTREPTEVHQISPPDSGWHIKLTILDQELSWCKTLHLLCPSRSTSSNMGRCQSQTETSLEREMSLWKLLDLA